MLRHIHGVLLLGGKNLFQKATHQFGRTVESIQIGFHVVPQVVVLVAPTGSFFLGSGKFFFQAAVLHIHHIAVVSLFFQFGKFFFGQRVVAEKGALADIADPYAMQPQIIMEEQESRRELYDGLKRLTQREQTYLLYRYGFTDGEEHPLIGTAIYFHLTKGRAKKTEEQAMDNLWLELPWWFL